MQAHTHRRPKEAKYRLLYVGSDLELVAALRKALGKVDCRLVACSDRESAIMFLKSDIPYQLLLIDWEWQGREGLKLARLVHTLKHRNGLTTMLLAANKLSRHIEAVAHKAGIRECIVKTKDLAEVIEAICTSLKAVN